MQTGSRRHEAPSIVGAYVHAWDTLKVRPVALLLILLVCGILQAVVNALSRVGEAGWLLNPLVVGPLTLGLLYSLLVAVRGHDPKMSHLFTVFRRGYLSAVWASFVFPVIVVVMTVPLLGALGIVMPGIPAYLLLGMSTRFALRMAFRQSPLLLVATLILVLLPVFVATRLSFAPYLLVDEQLAPFAALRESWNRTRPVQFKIAGIVLLLLLGIQLYVPLVRLLPTVGIPEGITGIIGLAGLLAMGVLSALALTTLYDALSSGDSELEDEGHRWLMTKREATMVLKTGIWLLGISVMIFLVGAAIAEQEEGLLVVLLIVVTGPPGVILTVVGAVQLFFVRRKSSGHHPAPPAAGASPLKAPDDREGTKSSRGLTA